VLELKYDDHDLAPEASRFAKLRLFVGLGLTVLTIACFVVCAIVAEGGATIGTMLTGK
jgi:hypothetical protein